MCMYSYHMASRALICYSGLTHCSHLLRTLIDTGTLNHFYQAYICHHDIIAIYCQIRYTEG